MRILKSFYVIKIVASPFIVVPNSVPIVLKAISPERQFWVIAMPCTVSKVIACDGRIGGISSFWIVIVLCVDCSYKQTNQSKVAFINPLFNSDFKVEDILDCTDALAVISFIVKVPSGLIVEGRYFVACEVNVYDPFDESKLEFHLVSCRKFKECIRVENKQIFSFSHDPKYECLIA